LLKVNGVLEHQNVTGDLPITGFTLGRRFSAEPRQPLAGDIAEFLVYNRRLSDSEISEVEAYLQVKWFTDPDGPPPISAALSATVAAGQLVVAWPVSVQGVVLQQTSPAAFPSGWSPVTTQVVEQDGNNTVTLDLVGQGQYFRLAPAP
jgi:hypothetical protein